MPKFEFMEATHQYLLDGVGIPSVTSVLPYNFFGNATEEKRLIGQYVHQTVELYEQNNLMEETLHEVLKDYLESYKLINNLRDSNTIGDWKTGVKHPYTEIQLAGYAYLVKNGVTESGEKLGVGCYHEISLYCPVYRLGGTPDYVFIKDTLKPFKVKAVYLKGNGKFPPQDDFTEGLKRNIGIFLSFLTVYKFKKERGLL